LEADIWKVPDFLANSDDLIPRIRQFSSQNYRCDHRVRWNGGGENNPQQFFDNIRKGSGALPAAALNTKELIVA
jgi:hypothetical protein